jgi:hypothetical protein
MGLLPAVKIHDVGIPFAPSGTHALLTGGTQAGSIPDAVGLVLLHPLTDEPGGSHLELAANERPEIGQLGSFYADDTGEPTEVVG